MPFVEVLEQLLMTYGYAVLFGFVFAESGLFFGFFLPGDSLLFTAGVLAQRGFFQLEIAIAGTIISAILGDQVGYWMGKKYGRGFFVKDGDFFRDPKHIADAERFYRKHGKITIVLARFVPAVRTFAPIVAGIGAMDYATFTVYNIAGGVLWSVSFILVGYLLGAVFPNAYEILTIIILGIIAISLIPVALEIFKKLRK